MTAPKRTALGLHGHPGRGPLWWLWVVLVLVAVAILLRAAIHDLGAAHIGAASTGVERLWAPTDSLPPTSWLASHHAGVVAVDASPTRREATR